MSVTIYLTDHNGRKIAFFYRIDNERYLTCPQLVWQCRDYRQYSGTCASKEEAFEAFKAVMKELNRSVPVRETKSCTECDKSLQGMENEGTTCNEHNFNR